MPQRRISRVAPWIIGVVAVVIVLAVAGPFVYIHFIQADPPEKLGFDAITTTTTTVPVATTAAGTGEPSATTTPSPAATTAAGSGNASTAAAGIDGAWKITDGTQVGYRVKETLFGQSTEGVGRTSTVTGQLTAAGTTISAAEFSVDMASIRSDQSQRDNQFRTRIMDVARFPTATFELTAPIDLGSLPADQQQVPVKATGDLTLRGTTKPVTMDLTARRNNGHLEVTGSLSVVFADWGIPNPSFGPASTADNGLLEVLLVFARA
jgi:polyisoprenoid-binding protein YceI